MKQYLGFMVWFKANYNDIYEMYWRNIEIGNSDSPIRINNLNVSEHVVDMLHLILTHYNQHSSN